MDYEYPTVLARELARGARTFDIYILRDDPREWIAVESYIREAAKGILDADIKVMVADPRKPLPRTGERINGRAIIVYEYFPVPLPSPSTSRPGSSPGTVI
jgi:hypothetical protein